MYSLAVRVAVHTSEAIATSSVTGREIFIASNFRCFGSFFTLLFRPVTSIKKFPLSKIVAKYGFPEVRKEAHEPNTRSLVFLPCVAAAVALAAAASLFQTPSLCCAISLSLSLVSPVAVAAAASEATRTRRRHCRLGELLRRLPRPRSLSVHSFTVIPGRALRWRQNEFETREERPRERPTKDRSTLGRLGSALRVRARHRPPHRVSWGELRATRARSVR